MSARGTIREAIWRSSRRNTLRTMSCSLFSITPASEPSTSMAWISSSVTLGPVLSRCPRMRSSSAVDPASRYTKGREAIDSTFIGRATRRAMPSGSIWPMRLGTSSPTTIDT